MNDGILRKRTNATGPRRLQFFATRRRLRLIAGVTEDLGWFRSSVRLRCLLTLPSVADGTAAVINDFFFDFRLFTRGSVALLQPPWGHGEPIGR